MKIKDLNGFEIEVTDLEEAIKTVERCRTYRHLDKSYQGLDETLTAYWTDMYDKLVQLRSERKQFTLKT